MNKPIIEGYVTGIAIIIITLLWIWVKAFHPLIIFALYLIGVFCVTLSALWQLAERQSIQGWLSKEPVRFFILGFVEVCLIVLFLDFYYLENLGDVLVEFHGLVFDLFLFGVILTLYETLRNRNSKIERYKEELDDYRGWTENEAAYRVAGLIKRLELEGFEDIDYSNLHLGNVEKYHIVKAIQNRDSSHYLFLPKANLDKIVLEQTDIIGNLQEVSLKKAILTKTYLSGNFEKANLSSASLREAHLSSINLEGARLRGTDFFKANLHFANLKYAILTGAKLRMANLRFAKLCGAKLQITDLRNADLTGADLTKADLRNADLTGANLRLAKLEMADFRYTKLKWAKVSYDKWLDVLDEGLYRNQQGKVLVKKVVNEYYLKKVVTNRDYYWIVKKKEFIERDLLLTKLINSLNNNKKT